MTVKAALAEALAAMPTGLTRGPARIHVVTQPIAGTDLCLWLAINPRGRKIHGARIGRRHADDAFAFVGSLYVTAQLWLDGAIAYFGADREIMGVDPNYQQMLDVFGAQDFALPTIDPNLRARLQAELDAAVAG